MSEQRKPATSIVVLIGLILFRLTVRDHLPYLAVLYYATPWLLLAAASAALALKLRNTKQASYATFLCMVCAAAQFQMGEPAESIDGTRLLLGNLRSSMDGHAAVLGHLEGTDLFALTEAGPFGRWCKENPVKLADGVQVSMPQLGLCLLANGAEIHDSEVERFGKKSRLVRYELLFPDQKLRVVLVDLESNPLTPRGPILEWVSQHVQDADIVMGDFNTPVNSVHMRRLKEQFVNPVSESHTGYYVTWPLPVPVLSLDQIWIRKGGRHGPVSLEPAIRGEHRSIRTSVSIPSAR